MKKRIILISFLLVLALMLTSCSAQKYKDGTYTGEFTDERNQKTTVELTIAKDKITAFSYVAYDKEGNEKGEEYGKDSGEAAYAIAQQSLASAKQYPELIVAAGDIEKVDAISGATSSLNNLKEATKDALSKAK